MEQTLSIIKPDAVSKNLIGAIYSRFEKSGFKIVAAQMLHLDADLAGGFYAVHKDLPFFGELVEFMTSGPVMVQVLERHDAINKYREIIGVTNPQLAEQGTIRADYADSISENAVHGSDSVETAAIEIEYFFGKDGLCQRAQ